jgi:hypothetical protein
MPTKKRKATPKRKQKKQGLWSWVVGLTEGVSMAKGVAVAGATIIGIVLAIATFGADISALRQSDHAPWCQADKTCASKSRFVQLEGSVKAAVGQFSQAVKQLDRQNDNNSQSWCEFYRRQEGWSRAKLAKAPSDPHVQSDFLFAEHQQVFWCGQLGK